MLFAYDKMDLVMRHKIIQKIVNFMLLIIVGSMFAGLFTALENTTFLLCFIVMTLLVLSYVAVRVNRIGDVKKGTQVIRGRIYAEHPFSSHLDGRQVVYEYYAEHIEIENHKGKSERIIDFREERIAQRIYLRDDFGKISLLQDQLKIHKNKGRIWPSDLQETNAY